MYYGVLLYRTYLTHRPTLRGWIRAEGWNCPTSYWLDANRVSLNPSSANKVGIGWNRTNFGTPSSFEPLDNSTTEYWWVAQATYRGVTLNEHINHAGSFSNPSHSVSATLHTYYSIFFKERFVWFLEPFSIRTQTYYTNIRNKFHISKEKSNYF